MKINEKNLCVFATSPPYDKEGFLNKRGEVNKAFQRRYFVLKGNLLFYFEKKGDKEPLGLIIVEGCTIELSEESDQYCFEIAFNGNRTYILSADSQESMESWMKALTCAGYEYKKLMLAELQRQLEEIEGSRNKMLGDAGPAPTTVSTPKPPPRRQNPFNRPAPPPPGMNGNGCTIASGTSFVSDHFGSSAKRPSNTALIERDTSPVPPPRGVPSANARSEFYIQPQQPTAQQPQQPQQQTQPQPQTQGRVAKASVFASSDDTAVADLPNHNAANFEQIHEKFREIVMKDVLAYQAQREIKARPLIEL